METLIKLIDSIAWPLTSIILGFMFRHEFRQILKRFNKLKYKDFEASFEKEIAKIENRTVKLKEKPSEISQSYQEQYYETYNRLLELSQVSPRAAISEAWREVEIITSQFIEKLGYNSTNTQMSKVLRNILAENNYPTSIYQDYMDLRNLRNKAVHAEEFEISDLGSEKYIITALDIILFIQKLSNDKKIKKEK
jgi:hypothetical protein